MIKRKSRKQNNNQDVELNLCNVDGNNIDGDNVDGDNVDGDNGDGDGDNSKYDSDELYNRKHAVCSSVSSSNNYKWSSYPLYFNSRPIKPATASKCIPILMLR